MKKMIALFTAVLLLAGVATGCKTTNGEGEGTDSTTGTSTNTSSFDASSDIEVISREEGSGTRGAFIELFGVEEKDADGNKVDMTTEEANITNSTSVMMTTVAGSEYAIGYISMGSMNDTVKALEIDGAKATTDNVKSGSYKIARPFHIATKDNISDTTKDFISYILSADGQKIVEDNGYITVSTNAAYAGDGSVTGKIVVAGSSSVTPVMEKLKEGYVAINSGVTIEVQQSDSTTGMTSAIEGICDIGMASRDVKDSELEKGLTATVIARDGIAVIVNNNSPLTGLTSQQVKDIFTGTILSWDELA